MRIINFDSNYGDFMGIYMIGMIRDLILKVNFQKFSRGSFYIKLRVVFFILIFYIIFI